MTTNAALARMMLAASIRSPRVSHPGGQPRGVPATSDLTSRETELLRLLATEGLTNRQLAERLGITTHTVRTHLDHMRIKLRVHNRVQLALAAQRLGNARV